MCHMYHNRLLTGHHPQSSSSQFQCDLNVDVGVNVNDINIMQSSGIYASGIMSIIKDCCSHGVFTCSRIGVFCSSR